MIQKLGSVGRPAPAGRTTRSSGTAEVGKAHDVGTLKSLLELCQAHELSPFHGITPDTRCSFVSNLGALTKRVGSRRLDRATGEDLLRWHREFAEPAKPGEAQKVRMAHSPMTTLRIVLKFGKVLDIADARMPRSVMGDIERATAPQRDASPLSHSAIRTIYLV